MANAFVLSSAPAFKTDKQFLHTGKSKEAFQPSPPEVPEPLSRMLHIQVAQVVMLHLSEICFWATSLLCWWVTCVERSLCLT